MFHPLILLVLSAVAETSPSDRLQYNRDIRPILSDNCFACHGPDATHRKAELRLDVRESALALGAVVPRSPEESALIERIGSDDPDEVMPPPDSHKTLSPRQKEMLRRWIAEGAEYQRHWSFLPPTRSLPPRPRDSGAVIRNPIDAFIQARLAREGLSPSPEASRETLIRRVTLDLTGLPPTLAEVDGFLADPSEDAYERVVDRLLASPHYGERMAVDWLDAARYADTNGYQVDRDRELWPWRDWVIRAFNANKPFDRFTVEQIAGDLLPGATLDQRIATGFHRNPMLNEEGGIIAEEFLAESTADRVETTAAVWLGQTFNCARCHDHKFDPFTQRDFYAMKAFFHNVPERGVGLYGNPIRRNAPPFVKLPAPEIEARMATLSMRLKAANEERAALAERATAGLEEWARRVAAAEVTWEPLEVLAAGGGEPPPHLEATTGAVEVGPRAKQTGTIRIKTRLPEGRITMLRVECITVAPEARLQWSEWTVATERPLRLRAVSADDALSVAEATRLVDGNRRTRAAVTVKSDRAVQAVFELVPALDGKTSAEIDIELGLESATGPSRWRVFASGTEADLLVPSDVRTVARKEAGERAAAERKRLVDVRLAQMPESRRLGDEVESLKAELGAAADSIPTTLVMEEMTEPRATHVLLRGAYDRPGEVVKPATPAVLPPLDDGAPRNRLGLARWLVSPRNPLTPRVVVNRFWQQVFGTGLVRTSEDFGSQGEPPSHPELLDWLAVEFRESGWDVKRLLRLIVTSASYRQQSRLTAVLRERDPQNRWLARGPRQRLMAELVRDQALAASGLLVMRLGGPSVKPYHPPGLYEQVTAGTGYTRYVPGQGDDLHRRSLYTYWKRSVPHPAMLLFDAPFRETCTLRRPRSNTPLQALNLMNDPTYVEAARFLARRMLREGGDTRDSRLIHGFRLLLARRPGPRELAVFRAALDRCEADFRADPEAARALLAVGDAGSDGGLDAVELASLATVAGTMLNLDEAITKE